MVYGRFGILVRWVSLSSTRMECTSMEQCLGSSSWWNLGREELVILVQWFSLSTVWEQWFLGGTSHYRIQGVVASTQINPKSHKCQVHMLTITPNIGALQCLHHIQMLKFPHNLVPRCEEKNCGQQYCSTGCWIDFVERTVPIQNICAEVELAAQINLSFIG
jgi:hypothetical protein